MLHVREDQLLVLLLVVQAELDQPREPLLAAFFDEREQRLVDVLPIADHLLQRGPRKHAALGARVACADRVVVRVEEHAEGGIEHPVAAHAGLEDERLEEPGGVREVPFDRARIRHGLQCAILGRKRTRERPGHAPDRVVALGKLVRREIGRRELLVASGIHPASSQGLRATPGADAAGRSRRT